jgi:hypothetical protein
MRCRAKGGVLQKSPTAFFILKAHHGNLTRLSSLLFSMGK